MIDLEGRSGFNLISNNTFELSNLSNEVIKISELIKEKHLKIKSKIALQNFNPVIVKLNNRLFTISYNSPDLINIEQDLVENRLSMFHILIRVIQGMELNLVGI